LFYAKLKSAINDIDQMDEHKSTFYPVFIDLHTKVVIEHIEKQYDSIINMKDVDGKGVEHIIEFFDNLGKSIMTYEK
jgi:hypothetical protein